MRLKLFSLAMIILFCGSSWAVSIAPQIIEQLKESGQLQSVVQADMAARQRGVWAPNPEPYRFGATAVVETLHCLIILVDFSDMPHEDGRNTQPADFDTLLFSLGVRHPGSMADYYQETSYSQAYLTGQVTQWYRMPQTYAYYVDGQRGFGNYPHNAQRLTEDAVTTADPDVDYSLYDNNQDGYVDALFVVHAGPGYEDTGNLNYIHSHAWVTSYQMHVDGVIVYGYSMEPEETANHQLETIGVFCHEFGHVLGLPDLYDLDYDSQGLGGWSVMAGGSWGGGGAVPVHFDAWCKYQLGWAVPTVLADNLTHEQIDAVEYNPDTYLLYPQGMQGDQYFLVENRRQALFDVSVPGSGILIYHVDESVPNNNDQNHYHVAVEQADGRFDLEHNIGADAGDPWPGSTNHRTFDDSSLPGSRLYDSTSSEVSVSNISDSDSTMFADLSIFFTTPLYEVLNMTINDSTGGNGNGRAEPGETCNLIFSAIDTRALVDTLTVILSCSDSSIVITDSVSSFGMLPTNEPFNNSSDPMTFIVPSGFASGFVNFYLDFVTLRGSYRQRLSQRILIGNPDLLLVDDDNGAAIDTFYTQALDSLGRSYIRWDVSAQGSPSAVLSLYAYVVWFTGDTSSDVFPSENVAAITSYLSGGGRLLMTSQDFAQHLTERGSPADLALLHDYLKVAYDDQEIDHRIIGQPGSVFDSLRFYTWGGGGAFNQTSEDNFIVQDGGIVLLNYQLNSNPAAVGAVGNYVAITTGFGMEGISDEYNLYSKRRVFLRQALQFLAQPTSIDDNSPVMPNAISLSQNYPNPFNPTTKIAFDIPKSGNVRLVIYDLLGRIVGKPVDGFMQAGHHSLTWDGSASRSGVYFYRLTSDGQKLTRRMMLLK